MRLIRCADADTAYATVEVRNPNNKSVRFAVHVSFADEYDDTLEATYHEVKVPAKGKVTAKVPVRGAGQARMVDHCVVDRDAAPA
ncbi:hypothetical protein OKJ48_41545 [Streptomyces kunmingensis]|uniref:Uncharacterized protein n=1 Tax=Streptomyces kunmingensis TaxID=68225 RepID=A0ABU6CPJ7_9ACTN|nr:hypothetical protein [Streptomyces kunmingensis]MEB3966670.1 hypothetical protein [Streptomyces kunmingensis]